MSGLTSRAAPQRWHLIRHGRIVATAWSSDGDAAAVELDRVADGLVVSDADWRETHWRRALLDWKRKRV